MLMGVRCDACVVWIDIPRKLIRYPAARDELDLILIFHLTAEVLLQKRYVWVFSRLDLSYSSIIQLRTIHIRSRSFILRVTALKSSFTFYRHYCCQMIRPILFWMDV